MLVNPTSPGPSPASPPDHPAFSVSAEPEPQRAPTHAGQFPEEEARALAGPQAQAALPELRTALERFCRPLGRIHGSLGCLFFLLLGAGIILWISTGFLVGCGVAVGGIVMLGGIAALMQKPLNRRAVRQVAEIQTRYNLSRDESFELLRSDEATAKVSQFKEFAIAVWGDSVRGKLAAQAAGAPGGQQAAESVSPTATAERKAEEELARGATPAKKFACGECDALLEVTSAGEYTQCHGCKKRLYVPRSPACPKCHSGNTAFLARKGKAAALRWGGQIAFGIVGGIIGSAMAMGLAGYHCNACQHDWALRLKA